MIDRLITAHENGDHDLHYLNDCPRCMTRGAIDDRFSDQEYAERTRPPATYREHMTTTRMGDGSNYVIACTCEWTLRLASLNDVHAAEAALLHVHAAQPESVEAIFDRLD